MDKPLPGKQYSGWSSIKNLVLKELVYTVGRPAKYALSDTGKDLSERLSQVNSTIENVNATPQPPCSSTIINLHPEPSPPVHQPPIFDITSDQLFRLLPGEHEIVLVLDNREVRGKKRPRLFPNPTRKEGNRYYYSFFKPG
ncbi:Crossover junction endonuclease mus81 [Entomophthora muscae]|uniref:Crossover junction endonuclease mus81 n=1 Tax=Entomophthora muscae TaxID=34485 RepID=A0ACC2STG3_9FUNG|nr:Crossover junction endonuclease mus81 [Entomophthora muscae]